MTKPTEHRPGAVAYLMVRNAAAAIEFYKDAFGAVEKMRFPAPGDRIGHAEIEIDGGRVFLADEWPDIGVQSPFQLGGTTVTVCVYVKNVDAFARRAEATPGLKVLRPLSDQFYGERSVNYQDPFGHVWNFSTITEELTPEEMMKRMESAKVS